MGSANGRADEQEALGVTQGQEEGRRTIVRKVDRVVSSSRAPISTGQGVLMDRVQASKGQDGVFLQEIAGPSTSATFGGAPTLTPATVRLGEEAELVLSRGDAADEGAKIDICPEGDMAPQAPPRVQKTSVTVVISVYTHAVAGAAIQRLAVMALPPAAVASMAFPSPTVVVTSDEMFD